eukprot:24907-Pelagococcus_subviridis.AAC.1
MAQPPPLPTYAVYTPPPPPSGVSIGGDLLDATTPDEVASLCRNLLLLVDDRSAAVAKAAKTAGCDKKSFEDFLSGKGLGRGGKGREESATVAGARRWLRLDAAAATLDAREKRKEESVSVDPGGLVGLAEAGMPLPGTVVPADAAMGG